MSLNADKLGADICSVLMMYTGGAAENVEGFDQALLDRIIARARSLVSNAQSGRITKETVDFMMEGVNKCVDQFLEALVIADPKVRSKVLFGVGFVVKKTLSDASGVAIASQTKRVVG